MAIQKQGQSIVDLEQWRVVAGPKSVVQWKDGRSAKEAAQAWLADDVNMPPEVAAVLASHPAFGPVLSWSAEPEARIPFDNLKGEPRNSDLLVKATDAHGHYVIAVEAKADESFGDTVGKTLDSAQQRLEVNERSGGVKRVNGLLAALFGSTLEVEPALAGLRYQLLTAVAGAASVAMRDKVSRVVMLVQEFRTDATMDTKHDANAKDLDAFVERLSLGAVTRVPVGQLVGPFTLQGAVLYSACVPVYVGKVRREMRALSSEQN